MRAMGAASLVALAGLLGSCAGSAGGARSEPPRAVARASATDLLRTAAAREGTRPDAEAMRAPLPPGVPERAVTRDPPTTPEESARRSLPIEDALAAASAGIDLGVAREDPPAPPSDDDKEQAWTHYASAIEMMLDGEPSPAIAEFQAAAKLDPGAAAVWVELGNAHARAGHRGAAGAAYKRAMRLGHDDPRIPWWLGRDALRSGKAGEAAGWFALARPGVEQRDADPSLRFLVAVDVAEAMESLGYVRASRDALTVLRDLPPTFPARTSLGVELAEVYRRRFDSLVRAGDLSCQLGEHARAMELYEEAGQLPAPDPGLTLPRRVLAAMRSGRPALAATFILDDLAGERARLEPRHAELATYLARHTRVGPQLSAALGEISGGSHAGSTPMQRARLALVRAAAAEPSEARKILEDALRDAPGSAELASAFVGSTPPGSLGALVDAAPDAIETLEDAILAHGRGVDDTVQALAGDEHAGSRTLAARLLRTTGRPVAALELLERRAFEGPPGSRDGMLVELGRAAIDRGRRDLAERALAALPEAAAIPRARLLHELGRVDDSLRALRASSLLDSGTTGMLLEAATLAAAGNDLALAERCLLRARDLDGYDDRVHDALFGLYSPGGLKPDAAAFGETIRALRQASPTGRLFRLLTARDMVQRAQFAPAAAQLEELTRTDPVDPRAVLLLAQCDEHLAKADPSSGERAERTFRELYAARPDTPAVVIGLARVLAARGKGEEAERILAERYARWPMDTIGVAREVVMRDALGDTAGANRLARERLERSPSSAKSAIALAEHLAAEGDFAGAARAFESRWPKGSAATPEFSPRAVTIASSVPPDAKGESATGGLALLDALINAGFTLPAPVMARRLPLAVECFPDQPVRLYEISLDTSRRVPEIGDRAFAEVVRLLDASPKPVLVCGFLGELAMRTTPWNPRYAILWMQAIATHGGADEAEGFLARLGDREAILQLVDEAASRPADPDAANTRLKADLAYTLASFMVQLGRESPAEDVYRIALRLDPGHALAANDLGYQMLERNENLPEAVRLIEQAWTLDTTRSSITDSIGWIRYKQGIMTDEARADGTVARVGAVSLLKRAIDLDDGNDDPSIQDHYGDALWRAGRKDDAIEAWRAAHRLATALIASARQSGTGERLIARLEPLARGALLKVEAASRGAEPAVAPLFPDDPALRPAPADNAPDVPRAVAKPGVAPDHP